MGENNKTLALFLTVIVIMSYLTLLTKPVNAQSLPKPSVPQFTLKFVDDSFIEAPIYSPNPFTGQNDLVQPSYYALNLSVEMIINNQPFTPYVDAKGNQIQLIYNVQWKPHYSTNWSGFGANNSRAASSSCFVGPMSSTLVNPSAPTTIFSFGLGQNNGTQPFYGDGDLGVIPLNGLGEVDFKVEAYIGYSTMITTFSLFGGYNEYYVWITGESSGFSNTQTITIPASSSSTVLTSTTTTSPNPTSTASVPELSWLAIVPLLLSSFCVAITFRYRKTRQSAITKD